MSRYFDGVLCISLARRAQRWRSLRERLRRWGIEAERIEAVDGMVVQPERRQPTAALVPSVSPSPPRSVSSSPPRLSPGELGCLMSHRKAIELARARDYRTVLVLEDDVCFHRRFGERVKELQAIGDGWDLLYLGATQYERRGRKFLNPHCYRARKTLGTFAYAMRATLFEQFLALSDVLDAPVDAALVRLQDDPANQCLVCDPPLAIADVRESDIRPERDLERHAARLGWKLEEYGVPEKAETSVVRGPLLVATDNGRRTADSGQNPKSKIENPKSVECRYRSLDESGTARCDHPCVHAPDGIVTWAVCQSCALREEPCDGVPARRDSQAVPSDADAQREAAPDEVSSASRGIAQALPEPPTSEKPLRDGLGRPSSARPEVLLAIDRFGWAFHSDAEGLAKHLAGDFAFTIVPHRELARHPEMVEGDLLVAFWWQSLLSIDTSRVGAVVCGLFDTWSWDIHGPAKLQAALDKASVLLVGNEYILEDLRNHPAGFRVPAVFVCEEGVDCELFRPQPFPAEFCVGWAGTTANARGFGGQRDGKGLGLIREAARLAGVPLVAAERGDAPRATASRPHPGPPPRGEEDRRPHPSPLPEGEGATRQIAHEAMPEEYYRRVSVQCVGSYSEGAPLTVAEALACGRPVIATNVGIVPRLVQHGVNGLVVPRDPAAMAEAMSELKRVGPETMSAAARRSALLYDWGRQAPKWAHCFRSAIDLAGRRTHATIAARPEYAAGEWEVKRVAGEKAESKMQNAECKMQNPKP